MAIIYQDVEAVLIVIIRCMKHCTQKRLLLFPHVGDSP